MRLSIEISPEQHYQIKAMAALQGKTIKEFVLNRVLAENDKAAKEELRKFLNERMEGAKSSKPITDSFLQIFEQRIQAKKA